MKTNLSPSRIVKISISATLTLAVMVVIFVMSAQDGNQSSGMSNGFGKWALELIGIQIEPGQSASDVVIFGGFKIRNLAHIFLYLCLGSASYALAASLWGIKLAATPRRTALCVLCAFAFSLVYACSDEFHQSFVPGRSATLRDIGIDCIGIALATACFAAVELIIFAVKSRRQRHAKND